MGDHTIAAPCTKAMINRLNKTGPVGGLNNNWPWFRDLDSVALRKGCPAVAADRCPGVGPVGRTVGAVSYRKRRGSAWYVRRACASNSPREIPGGHLAYEPLLAALHCARCKDTRRIPPNPLDSGSYMAASFGTEKLPIKLPSAMEIRFTNIVPFGSMSATIVCTETFSENWRTANRILLKIELEYRATS